MEKGKTKELLQLPRQIIEIDGAKFICMLPTQIMQRQYAELLQGYNGAALDCPGQPGFREEILEKPWNGCSRSALCLSDGFLFFSSHRLDGDKYCQDWKKLCQVEDMSRLLWHLHYEEKASFDVNYLALGKDTYVWKDCDSLFPWRPLLVPLDDAYCEDEQAQVPSGRR